MCGIVCCIPQHPKDKRELESIMRDMVDVIEHRGPDASGVYVPGSAHFAFGATRLSLVDLDKRSNQPFRIGDHAIVYNGEIYNHLDVREKLSAEGVSFTTTSDTETLLAALMQWGIDKTLPELNGCFAFAWFDASTNAVIIARDPQGEKQIEYTTTPDGTMIFASELKSIFAYPEVRRFPNINRFLMEFALGVYGYSEETYFEGILHLQPGCYVRVKLGEKKLKATTTKYHDIAVQRVKIIREREVPDVTKQVLDLLNDSVRIRMMADAPVGAILSGGLDSSFITSLAVPYHHEYWHNKLESFTVSYSTKSNRDLENAKRLEAAHEYLRVNEVLLEPEYLTEEIVDQTTYALEEPDWSTIYPAMMRVYGAARKKGLKAVINGQGSDEQWLGYFMVEDHYQLPRTWLTPEKMAYYWYESSPGIEYLRPHMQEKSKELIKESLDLYYTPYRGDDARQALVSFALLTKMQQFFYQEDRFSMANSVEVRLPYVDPRILDLSMTISTRLKTFDKREKYILRKAAKKVLPASITKRKKQGFPWAPSAYDKAKNKLIQYKDIAASPLVNRLFDPKKLRELFESEDIEFRWKLYAITRFEKVWLS